MTFSKMKQKYWEFKIQIERVIHLSIQKNPYLLKNGHVHTPFCPHGTKDHLNDYIERAIQLGFKEISFTEHGPLPKNFTDPTPNKDSGMDWEELDLYIQEIEKLKNIYKDQMIINCGLEIDYIEGYEEEIRHFLNEYGKFLDDSILSVHFLKHDNRFDCLDYSPQVFEGMIHKYGSIEKVYEKYFSTVKKSIIADLGPYKPKRIGHMTLVRKFQKKFPHDRLYESTVLEILQLIKGKQYELDLNGAGVAKPLCREPYPSFWIIKKALQLGIPLIYGSDAHQVKELDQGLDVIKENGL